MNAQQTVPYYEGRIDKISKSVLKDSILVSTWVYDRSLNAYRGHTPESESEAWSKYVEDKNLKNRNNLFDGYVWYAAYVAYYNFINQEKTINYLSYSCILQFCLEKLITCIDNYMLNNDNRASFYTYYLNCVKKQLSPSMKAVISVDNNIGISIFDRYFAIRSLMNYHNDTINDILKMSDDEYKRKYKCVHTSKDRLIKLFNFIDNRISLNEHLSENIIDEEIEILYTIADDKYESISNKIDNEFIKETTDKVFNYLYSRNSNPTYKRNIEILMHHMHGHTYDEIANIMDLGLTRQRIQQIVINTLKVVFDNRHEIFNNDELEEMTRMIY